MRLLLKRPLSDLWLDLDVQASEITYTEVLNGPGDITVRLPLSFHNRIAEDGYPVVSEYETLMIVENHYDGLSVALVDSIELTEHDMVVSGAGLSVLAKNVPWLENVKTYAETDAVEIFRDIWGYILSHPNADVDLKITGGTESGVLVGTSPSQDYKDASETVDGLKADLSSLEKELKQAEEEVIEATSRLFRACGLYTVGQVKWQSNAPSEKVNVVWLEDDNGHTAKVYRNGYWTPVYNIRPQIEDYVAKRPVRDLLLVQIKNTKSELEEAKKVLNDLSEEKGEPYELNWWKTHDLNQKLSEMVDIGGFEFIERASWNGEDINLSLEIGAPRIGSRKDELVFELGVNVMEVPTFKQIDPYTDVLILGAGEGSATLNAQHCILNTPRVRRVRVVTDKDAVTQEQVRARSRSLIQSYRRENQLTFDTLIVKDHPWARPSEYDVGDEIRVTGTTFAGMYFDQWVRIMEKTVSANSEDITLKVEVV